MHACMFGCSKSIPSSSIFLLEGASRASYSVKSFGFKVYGPRCRVLGLEVLGLGFGVHGYGFSV